MDKNEALQVALQAMRSMKKDLDDYAAEVGEDYDDLTADMMVGDQLNYIEGKVVSEPFKGALFFSSEHEVMESIINNMWDEGDRLGKKACRFEEMDAPEVVIDRVMERSDLYISAAYTINDEVLPTLSKETVKLPNRKVKTKAYRDWEDGKESCIKCECTLHGKNSAWYMMDDKCDEVCKDCEDWDDDQIDEIRTCMHCGVELASYEMGHECDECRYTNFREQAKPLNGLKRTVSATLQDKDHLEKTNPEAARYRNFIIWACLLTPIVLYILWGIGIMIKALMAIALVLIASTIYIPLGPKVEEGLDFAAISGVIRQEQILSGLPHPSGANAERIAYFLNEKPVEKLSAKTNPQKIDDAREKVMAKVASI